MNNKSYSENFIYGICTCQLLSSVLNGTEPVALSKNIDLDALYTFESDQSVANMTYEVLKKLGYSEEKLKKFQDEYKVNMLREARFELAGQQVFDALEKAKIPFIPLKGAVLKNLYPNPALRNFTDYDIFIDPNKYEKIKNIMQSLGYFYDGDTENDMDFVKKPSLHFEMHFSLFTSAYDFNGYFNKPFEKTYLKEGKKYFHLYRNEDFLVHVLAHLYKHFTDGGCGIKQFMDMYVLTKKLELDMDYIHNELETIGLNGFLETVIRLNAFLFDSEKPDDNLLEIADYVFNCGTFGSVKNNMALEYAQDNEDAKKHFGLYKMKYFANRWQLSFSGMKKQYPILGKLPFLLPFCYFHKLFKVVFFKRGVIKSQVKDINDFSDDYSKHIDHILEISKAKIKK